MEKQNWANIILSFVMLFVAISIVFIVNKISEPKSTFVYIDQDKDGYYVTAKDGLEIDCDDGDNKIYPGATEIEGDGIDQDCDGFDKLPDFDPDQVNNSLKEFEEFYSLKNKQNKYIKLYDSFVSPDVISNEVIVNNSKRIKTSGKFEKAYLFIIAKINRSGEHKNLSPKLTDEESIYFYIDIGDKGGHLIKSKSFKVNNEKLELSNGDAYLYKANNIELTSLPYKEENTPVLKKINLLEILNSENGGYDRKHYIGSFVSTSLGKGELVEFGITYKCEVGYSCSIQDITE